MKNVLVVGGGITTARLCHLLTQQQAIAMTVSVWDKARYWGGRMTTFRSKEDKSCIADLGAQYFTFNRTKYQQIHGPVYEELKSAGVLQPLTGLVENMASSQDECQHFVAPMGSSSLTKHFFEMAKTDISFQERVVSLDLDEEKAKWNVKTESKKEASFDAVVLTMPVPQVLQLKGDIAALIEHQQDLKRQLEKVEYSARYALALFFDSPLESLDNFEKNVCAKYIRDHPIFRFVAVDSWKRGQKSASTAVVLHTSVGFGKEHVEQTPEEVMPLLKQEAMNLFPTWPQPASARAHKWRYSQVTNAFKNQPGFVVIHNDPLLIVTGDGFTHSNLDGCLLAASRTAEKVAERVSN